MPGPVVVARFRDLMETHLAKGRLESAGIACDLADHELIRMDWFVSNAIGGIKLQVAEEDAAEAAQVLGEGMPLQFTTEEVGSEYRQPPCPQCGSLDIAHNTLNRPLSFATMFINFPVTIPYEHWKCADCGAEWRWEGPGEYDAQPPSS
jgi:hypothetical protein